MLGRGMFGNVYQAIDDETRYQEEKWPSQSDTTRSIADWLVFIENHVAAAKSALYVNDNGTALHEMRKIAALAVKAMFFRGVRTRESKDKIETDDQV